MNKRLIILTIILIFPKQIFSQGSDRSSLDFFCLKGCLDVQRTVPQLSLSYTIHLDDPFVFIPEIQIPFYIPIMFSFGPEISIAQNIVLIPTIGAGAEFTIFNFVSNLRPRLIFSVGGDCYILISKSTYLNIGIHQLYIGNTNDYELNGKSLKKYPPLEFTIGITF